MLATTPREWLGGSYYSYIVGSPSGAAQQRANQSPSFPESLPAEYHGLAAVELHLEARFSIKGYKEPASRFNIPL